MYLCCASCSLPLANTMLGHKRRETYMHCKTKWYQKSLQAPSYLEMKMLRRAPEYDAQKKQSYVGGDRLWVQRRPGKVWCIHESGIGPWQAICRVQRQQQKRGCHTYCTQVLRCLGLDTMLQTITWREEAGCQDLNQRPAEMTWGVTWRSSLKDIQFGILSLEDLRSWASYVSLDVRPGVLTLESWRETSSRVGYRLRSSKGLATSMTPGLGNLRDCRYWAMVAGMCGSKQTGQILWGMGRGDMMARGEKWCHGISSHQINMRTDHTRADAPLHVSNLLESTLEFFFSPTEMLWSYGINWDSKSFVTTMLCRVRFGTKFSTPKFKTACGIERNRRVRNYTVSILQDYSRPPVVETLSRCKLYRTFSEQKNVW
jgi:hypothetical protein